MLVIGGEDHLDWLQYIGWLSPYVPESFAVYSHGRGRRFSAHFARQTTSSRFQFLISWNLQHHFDHARGIGRARLGTDPLGEHSVAVRLNRAPIRRWDQLHSKSWILNRLQIRRRRRRRRRLVAQVL